ncbi:reverse transcriptase domain-containing protein [Tanacetum coccineum]
MCAFSLIFTKYSGHLQPPKKERTFENNERRRNDIPTYSKQGPVRRPLHISVGVYGRRVGRVLLDRGTACDKIYEHCFLKLRKEVKERRKDVYMTLSGFFEDQVNPLGEISLLTTVGEAPHHRIAIRVGNLLHSNGESSADTNLQVKVPKNNLPDIQNNTDYEALLVGLVASVGRNMKDLHVSVDSKVLVDQVEGSRIPRTKEAKRYREEIMDATDPFHRFQITYLPKSLNPKAEALTGLQPVCWTLESKVQ